MPKTYEPWIKMPNEIYGLSLQNEMVVPVFVYLCTSRNLNDLVFGTTHKIAHSCGLASNSRPGKPLDQCKAALEMLKREGYIADYSLPGYVCRKHEHYFELADAKFDSADHFARIEYSEISKLLEHRYGPGRNMDCSSSYEKLLRVLFYIRLNQTTIQEGEDSELIFGLLRIEQIACDLGISYRTALNAVTVLRNLCIIDYMAYRVLGWDKQWKTVGSIFIPNHAADNSFTFDKIIQHLKHNNSYR